MTAMRQLYGRLLVSVVGVIGAFGLVLSVVFVPAFLTLGGYLLAKESERKHRAVRLVAALLGFALAGTVLLAIATTAI